MSAMGRAQAGKGPVSSHTVDETMRINFTRQLLQLRDEAVTEVVFPSTLDNIERKFLHKLSEELGLKSKSSGKGENRKITVSKKANSAGLGGAEPDLDAIKLFSMQNKSLNALNAVYPDAATVAQTATFKATAHSEANSFKRQRGAANTVTDDAASIKASYEAAKAKMESNPRYATMQAKRQTLPAHEHRAQVCQMIKDNQIVLISGETGCGKTTQVPQYILEDPEVGPTCRIAVAQPRRLSAVSVAERIAAERCEPIGNTVGFNIRLESEKSKSTQVLFVTPGVLLRKLQNDPLLEEFSHIVIDEAHERDRFTEFLTIVLRDICHKRPELKLILMSATMHTNKLTAYFGGVPQLHLGGSVFPVQEFFLEDVLKVTDYLSAQQGASYTGSQSDQLAAYVRSKNTYTCAQCTGGPFRSPEELGTHAAMCFTVAPANVRQHAKRQQRTDLNDLVRNLTRIIGNNAAAGEAGAKAKAVTAVMNSKHGNGNGNGNNGNKNHQGNNKGKATSAATEGEEAPTGGDKNDEDRDGEGDDMDSEGPDSASDSDSDGEDSEEDGVVREDGIESVRNANRDVPVVEDNALLQQYQVQFDDSQVDYDLIYALLQYTFKSEFGSEGSVLIFMPGWQDISTMFRMLQASPDFGPGSEKMNGSKGKVFRLLQLHSGIPRKDQNAVFASLGKNEHKIILATNIAETSITIDDVAVVIDAGRLKEKVYDPHVKLAYLKSEWVSRASARQRKGRAGRTRSGVCFHLFSKRRHESLPAHQDSELLRTPLEEVVLQTKVLNVAPGKGEEADSAHGFLMKAMDPPHELSIKHAISLLTTLQCLDPESEAVTSIGKAVSRLPMDPRTSRAVILGCMLGVGPSMLSVAAAMGYRDPFVLPASPQQRMSAGRAKVTLARGSPSDPVVAHRALQGYTAAHTRFGQGKAYNYCDQNFLSPSTLMYLKDMIGQLNHTVKDNLGFNVNNAQHMRNDGSTDVLMACVGMALYPDIGARRTGAAAFSTEKGRKAKIHPASLNFKGKGAFPPTCKKSLELVGFQDLVSVTAVEGMVGAATLSMLNTSPVSLLGLMLTAGSVEERVVSTETVEENKNEEEEEEKKDEGVLLTVDDWLPVRLSVELWAIVRCARSSLFKGLDHFVHSGGNLPKELQREVDAIAQALMFEQQQVSPTLEAGGQDNFGNQQAERNSRANKDQYSSAGGRQKYFGGQDHKNKYKV